MEVLFKPKATTSGSLASVLCPELQGEGVRSERELGSSPVSPLSVVPDFVVSLVSDPVRHRPVLLNLLGESDLLSERLNRSLQ